MADRTAIEWTESSWTPVKGCTRASEGCRNCYAEIMTARFSAPGQWGEGLARIVETPAGKDHRWTGALRFDEHELLKPLSWRRPRMIFVCSTSDLFHEKVEQEWLDRIFAVMALAPQHTFQVLTKRPERMRDYLRDPRTAGRVARLLIDHCLIHGSWRIPSGDHWPVRSIGDIDQPDDVTVDLPLPNVWLGVSAEDQVTADVRIPYLLDTPAAVRWVSAEPLIGPISFRWAAWHDYATQMEERRSSGATELANEHDGLRRLDWIVAGGESGPGARPMHPDWVRTIRDQCAEAGVAFFFKQWGAWGRALPKPSETAGRYALASAPPYSDFMPAMVTPIDAYPRQFDLFGGATVLEFVGKKAAGRTLDGRLHAAFPAIEEVPFG